MKRLITLQLVFTGTEDQLDDTPSADRVAQQVKDDYTDAGVSDAELEVEVLTDKTQAE